MNRLLQRAPSMKEGPADERCCVRSVLREATAETHMRMHQLKPFRLLEQGQLGPDAYAELLIGLTRFHSLIADEARRYGLSIFSSSARKVQLLHGDLAALSRTHSETVSAFKLPSAKHALGALYVAEGSMFGGKLLARQLDYLFGKEPVGREFFRGAPEDALQWRALVRELETHAGHRAALKRMISGADLAFRLFERCVLNTDPTPPMQPPTTADRRRDEQRPLRRLRLTHPPPTSLKAVGAGH